MNQMATLPPLRLLDEVSQVAATLTPMRRQMLEILMEPESASGLARQLDVPRQTVNYHLRELEEEGLVKLAETRRRRGFTERRMRVTARAFFIDPTLLGSLAENPELTRDHFSSAYLIAEAAQTIREVAVLRERAKAVEKRLPTFTLSADLRFSSPSDLQGFSEELREAVIRIAARYVRGSDRNSRAFRVTIGAHPTLTKSDEQARQEAAAHSRKKRNKKKRKKT
jgi:DNA-binding transcriptional ArsR family regulator